MKTNLLVWQMCVWLTAPSLLKSGAQPLPWASLWDHLGFFPKQWIRQSQISQTGFGFAMFCPLSYTVVNIKHCFLKVHGSSVNVDQRYLCKTIDFWVFWMVQVKCLNSLSYYLFWSVPVNHISYSVCLLQPDWNKNGNVICCFMLGNIN